MIDYRTSAGSPSEPPPPVGSTYFMKKM